MTRELSYSRDSLKVLERIDKATSARIQAKVRQLADDPASLANNVKPLKGTEGLWRLRVGDWRVIYSETRVVLHVIRVAPRGGAYD